MRKEPDKIDEVMLAAFVDDQLDAINREAIIKAMDTDDDLRERVYNLRKTKDLIKLSFGDAIPPETRSKRFTTPLFGQCMARIAAGLATVIVGLIAGFAGYNYGTNQSLALTQNLAELTQQQGERIILHISESSPAQFETTLTYTEKFLNEHKNNGKARIEVVANAGGIDLLRKDFPLSDKVTHMMDEYDNLTFVACTNAVNNLRAQGFDATMIKNVETDKAALTHIIDRLQDGWSYIRVDSKMMQI